MHKDVICAVPWMHLNLEPDGKVIPCCITSYHQYYVGDIKEQPIEEIWNSDKMKALRQEMAIGIKPKICSTCYDREKAVGSSNRTHHNFSFPEVIEKIPNITMLDGTCTEMKLKYWDFRFSNLCNFKCRSCGPRYSSSWVPDAKKLGWTEQEKVWNIKAVDNKSNYKFLEEQINEVKKIYFAGGEPLLMDEHWYILDLLVKYKRFDVEINYNTNASTLEYGSKNVLDYWKLWEPGKIEVWPSIDEIGERAELIRSGTIWSKVEQNIIDINKLDNLIVRPGITVGAWNVFRLPVILEHLIKIGVIKESSNYKNWFINLLEHPVYYHVTILPDVYKNEIIDNLLNFIEVCRLKYNTDLHGEFEHILSELKKPYNSEAAERFVSLSHQVDEIRNENIFETIPEMKMVVYKINHSEKA